MGGTVRPYGLPVKHRREQPVTAGIGDRYSRSSGRPGNSPPCAAA
jgi:hypothetical protein